MSAKQETASLDDSARTDAPQAVTVHHKHDLSRALRVPVTIDQTGWLRTEIEILYDRSAVGLQPVHAKVGRQALLEDVRAVGDVYLHFERYNVALSRLHRLKLKQVDRDIVNRQRDYMGNGTVRVRTLLREIAHLEQLVAELGLVEVPAPAAADDRPRKETVRCP